MSNDGTAAGKMRRSTLILLATASIAMIALIPISESLVVHHNVREGEATAYFGEAGLKAEINGIRMLEDGVVNYKMKGEGPFNVYIVTYDEFIKATEKNESFAYVGELSAFNVTTLDIRDELSQGEYLIYVESLQAGKVTCYYIDEIYSPGGNALLIWDMALIIASVVILTVVIIFYGSRKKSGP